MLHRLGLSNKKEPESLRAGAPRLASHLNRNAVCRILKAEGLNRLPAPSRSRKPDGAFKDYEFGFVHLNVKHVPKLRDRNGVARKRYLYVAIDRSSPFLHPRSRAVQRI